MCASPAVALACGFCSIFTMEGNPPRRASEGMPVPVGAAPEFGHSLLPPIGIVKSHDVILAKKAANLNLNQFQRNFSRVGRAGDCP
jgi:hypothetical protein